jgi:hypothetical protein
MDSFLYLKEKLSRLIVAIPYIRVRYSFDSEFQNHIVEIKPSEVYRDDVAFAENESSLCLDFSDKFPYESIIFISEDDSVKIDSADVVLYGELYNTGLVSFNWCDILMENEIIDSPVKGKPCLNSDYALAA